VTFGDPAWRTISDISRQRGIPLAEVIREALSTYRWLLEVRSQGGHVLIERDGKVREVISL
jgi:hypothetical protein